MVPHLTPDDLCRTFWIPDNIPFLAIDLRMAVLDSTNRPEPSTALEKSTRRTSKPANHPNKDGKPLNFGEQEIKQVGEENRVPQYVKGKFQKFIR